MNPCAAEMEKMAALLPATRSVSTSCSLLADSAASS